MRHLEGAQQALVKELVRGEAGDVLAVHHHAPRGGRQDAGYDVEERGLARAVRADQAGDRAGGDGQARPVHGAEAPEMPVQVMDLDHASLVSLSRPVAVPAGAAAPRRAPPIWSGAAPAGGGWRAAPAPGGRRDRISAS